MCVILVILDKFYLINFMQDPRYIHNLEGENNYLKAELNKMNLAVKSTDEKYRKSLQEMSAIIQANRNLKLQLDQIKINTREKIDQELNTNSNIFKDHEKKILADRDQKSMQNQHLKIENQQLRNKIEEYQKQIWQNQALKNELAMLKKENEQLILEKHPLTQKSNENPQNFKEKQMQMAKLVDSLKQQISYLEQQGRRQHMNFDKDRKLLQRQIESLTMAKKQNESENKTNMDNSHQKILKETRKLNEQIFSLRQINAQLTNQIQKLKLGAYEKQAKHSAEMGLSEQAQSELLNTLKTLHSQLEPMRYEIEQLRREKYHERQTANKEKTALQMELLTAQNEVEGFRKFVKQLQHKNQDLISDKRQYSWNKNRMYELEEEKRILEGRVVVYQAMEMVARNRQQPHHIQRINQFQRRIRLLLEEQSSQFAPSFQDPRKPSQNLHQLIAMKAYILQLDSKLQSTLSQHDHLHKKYQHYKQKYAILLQQNKNIVSKHNRSIQAYRGKIVGYEKLVNKLTLQLQKYLSQFVSSETKAEQSHKSIVVLYQTKITHLYQQINSLKQSHKQSLQNLEQQCQELKYKNKDNYNLSNDLMIAKTENTQLKGKLTKMQYQLEILRGEANKKVTNVYSEDQYKMFLLEKNKKIIQLEEKLQKVETKLQGIQYEHEREFDSYRIKVNRLEMQIDQLREENFNMSKNIGNNNGSDRQSFEIETLVSKITNLQRNMEQSRRVQILTPNHERQLMKFKEQNIYLRQQLQKLRKQLKDKLVSKNNQLQDLRNRSRDETYTLRQQYQLKIRQIRERILFLQSEVNIKTKQLEYKEKQINRNIENIPKNNNNTSSATIINLQSANSQLRLELEQMKKNYLSAAKQSQQLVFRIKEMEEYIGNLRIDFDSVSRKLHDFEREIAVKDAMIKEKEYQYRSMYEKYERQIKYISNSTVNVQDNSQQLKQRERELQQRWDQFREKQYQHEKKAAELRKFEKSLIERQRQLEQRISIGLEKQYQPATGLNQIHRLESQLRQRQRELQQRWDYFKEKQYEQQKKSAELKKFENRLKQRQNQLQQRWDIFKEKQYEQEIKWTQIRKIEMKINERQEYLLKMQRQIQSKNIHTSNDRQIDNLKREIARLQEQLRRQKNKPQLISPIQTNSMPIKQHQKIINQYQARIRDLQDQHQHNINIVRNKHATQEKQLRHTIDLLEMDIKSRDNRIQWLLKDIEKMSADLQEGRQQNYGKDDKFMNMRRQLQEANHKLLEKDLEIEKLRVIENREYKYKEQIMVLEDQLDKVNGILLRLQQQQADNMRNKYPPTPPKQYMPEQSVYQSELLDKNSKLQQDLELLRSKFLSNVDNDRNLDQYLTIMVITFAQVDSLRERLRQLQENFKKQHENNLNMMVHLQNLTDVDSQVHFEIIKELQQAHKLIHEQESISKKKYSVRKKIQARTVSEQSEVKKLSPSLQMKTSIENTMMPNMSVTNSQHTQYSHLSSPQYNVKDQDTPYRMMQTVSPQSHMASYQVNQSSGNSSGYQGGGYQPNREIYETKTEIISPYKFYEYSESSIGLPSQTSLKGQVNFAHSNQHFQKPNMPLPPPSGRYPDSQNSFTGPYMMSNNQLYR